VKERGVIKIWASVNLLFAAILSFPPSNNNCSDSWVLEKFNPSLTDKLAAGGPQQKKKR
jgi:hypothetical protein